MGIDYNEASYEGYFDAPPPPSTYGWCEIIEPHVEHSLSVLIVGRRSYGIQHHWIPTPEGPKKGYSRPCTAQWGECECLRAPKACQWAAYLAVQVRTGGPVAVARLTQQAVLSCPALMPGSGEALRGKGLVLTRHAGKHNGPVTAELIEPSKVHGVIPAEPDVVAWLFHLWGLPDPRRRK